MSNINNKFQETLKMLNKQQAEAVNAIEGPVLVVAGPGTGKTQILAARIGQILQQTDSGAENILALTFTDAGAVAMRKRLIDFIGADAYKITINTFHAFSNNIIQQHPYIFGKGALDQISDLEQIEYLEKIIKNFPAGHPMKRWKGDNEYDRNKLKSLFDTMKKEGWSSTWLLKKIDEWIEEEKNNTDYIYKRKYKEFNKGDLNINKYTKDVLDPMNLLKSVVPAYDTYQKLMQENGRYDYNDMIIWVLDKFKDPEHIDLLQDNQERYHYILVDEYQDTNGTQNELLDLLISYWDAPNVFVVGDDDQSIYRFQGANVTNITEFSHKYKNDLKVVELIENYRSTQAILDSAKELIENNKERLVNDIKGLNKNLNAALPVRQKSTVKPQVRIYQNEAQQSVHIAQEVQKLFDVKEKLSNVAIIYSKHAHAKEIIRYFDLKEIPYQIKRRNNILESTFIKNLLNMLVYVTEESYKPHSREDLLFEIIHYNWFNVHSLTIAKIAYELRRKRGKKWREVISTYGMDEVPDIFNVGKTEQVERLRKVSQFIEHWITESKNVTVPILVEKIIAQSGLLNYIINSPKKVELMQELHALYGFVKEESARNPNLTIADLMKAIDKMKENSLSIPVFNIVGDPDGVMFTTAHGSKGLEFNHVYILRCTQEAWEKQRGANFNFKLPKNLVIGDQGSDEEEKRRLFYVAVTRAEANLNICVPKYKYDGKELTRSQFVTELLVSNSIEKVDIELPENEVLEFQLNILEEPPTPPMAVIEKQLIDRVLQKYVLSVTHLTSYLKCPKNFYFSAILRVPAAANKNMAFGNVMHSTLEEYFNKMKEQDEFPPKAELLKLFDKWIFINSDGFTDEAFKSFKEYGHHLLPLYYDKYINTWSKVVSLEYRAQNIEVDDIPMKGVMDKLEFDGNDVNVVDYKTGKYKKEKFVAPKPEDKWKDPLNPTFEEKYGGDYWRQAVFYKILVDADPKNKWNVKSTEFDFLEQDHKDKTFKKHLVPILAEDIAIVKQQIKEGWAGIQSHNFEGECKDEYCRWCGFVSNNYDKIPEATEEDGIEQIENNNPLVEV